MGIIIVMITESFIIIISGILLVQRIIFFFLNTTLLSLHPKLILQLLLERENSKKIRTSMSVIKAA